ncbi:DUF3017 domain-containing protein [Branchiibius sp. NY16-3462-2]|uniref:DUF3017 domain-containing protein n=1 Tax=Branchiibius sp. NY16-3462-2 TaxID=1807500 RepID=UPI0007958967|nr:DUF3017 domain-containing protein [Branchiibius sp. NY16-3462-2]KYH43075.1 hypothetical protein AZH51_06395 [Branchiibius sp. NY16-3462-2]
MNAARLGSAWWALAVLCAAGLVMIVADSVRMGGYVIGSALLAAAAVRALVPSSKTPGLAIRHRVIDVCLYGGLGLATILIFAVVVL